MLSRSYTGALLTIGFGGCLRRYDSYVRIRFGELVGLEPNVQQQSETPNPAFCSRIGIANLNQIQSAPNYVLLTPISRVRMICLKDGIIAYPQRPSYC